MDTFSKTYKWQDFWATINIQRRQEKKLCLTGMRLTLQCDKPADKWELCPNHLFQIFSSGSPAYFVLLVHSCPGPTSQMTLSYCPGTLLSGTENSFSLMENLVLGTVSNLLTCWWTNRQFTSQFFRQIWLFLLFSPAAGIGLTLSFKLSWHPLASSFCLLQSLMLVWHPSDWSQALLLLGTNFFLPLFDIKVSWYRLLPKLSSPLSCTGTPLSQPSLFTLGSGTGGTKWLHKW